MKSIHISEITSEMISNIIDIREPAMFNINHIEGVKNIPMMGLLLNHETFLQKDQTYYIMCQMGVKSQSTVIELTKLGYNVINVEGGMSSYVEKN